MIAMVKCYEVNVTIITHGLNVFVFAGVKPILIKILTLIDETKL